MLLDVGWWEFSKCFRCSIFFSLNKIGFAPWPDIMLNQTLIYCLHQTVKPSFNDTIVLFVGLIEQYNGWSILMWCDLILFLCRFCLFTYMVRLLLMTIMNCFCGMVDRRKSFSPISSRDHCQRSSPSRIPDTWQAGFELVQNLSSGLVEMKLCSNDNHCTMAPQTLLHGFFYIFKFCK